MLKRFQFALGSNSGDDIQLDINAETKEEAKHLAKEFLESETQSYQDAYESKENYMITSVQQRIKKNKDYFIMKEENGYDLNEIKEEKQRLHNHPYWSNRNRTFSINDFIMNKKEFLESFARQSAEGTYIAGFLRKEYTLEEINLDKKGIQSSTFVYTGR